MLSRDVGFASSQAVYARYARIWTEGKKCSVDLADADGAGAHSLLDHFYVSARGEIDLSSCIGGEIRVYEKKKWHTNYEITRHKGAKIVTFEFL